MNPREIPPHPLWMGQHIVPLLREAAELFRGTPGTVFVEFFPATFDAEKGPDWHLKKPIRARAEILSPEAAKKVRKIVLDDRAKHAAGGAGK